MLLNTQASCEAFCEPPPQQNEVGGTISFFQVGRERHREPRPPAQPRRDIWVGCRPSPLTCVWFPRVQMFDFYSGHWWMYWIWPRESAAAGIKGALTSVASVLGTSLRVLDASSTEITLVADRNTSPRGINLQLDSFMFYFLLYSSR